MRKPTILKKLLRNTREKDQLQNHEAVKRTNVDLKEIICDKILAYRVGIIVKAASLNCNKNGTKLNDT